MRQDYLQGTTETQTATEKEIERALRPVSFDDFTGQEKIMMFSNIFSCPVKSSKETGRKALSISFSVAVWVSVVPCK